MDKKGIVYLYFKDMTFKYPHSSKQVRKNKVWVNPQQVGAQLSTEEAAISGYTEGCTERGSTDVCPGTGWWSKNVHFKAVEDTKSKGSVNISKDRVKFQNFLVNLRNSLGKNKTKQKKGNTQ